MGTICKSRNKEEERKKRQNERKDLTLTGLLMEGATENFSRFSVSILHLLVRRMGRAAMKV
jgi:hypothetical protein